MLLCNRLYFSTLTTPIPACMLGHLLGHRLDISHSKSIVDLPLSANIPTGTI